MSNEQIAIPDFTFKNIVVTVTEDAEKIVPSIQSAAKIYCVQADTILNFQLVQAADGISDFHFTQPDIKDDTFDQLGAFTISKSGKMLTVCNATSTADQISITLHVHDVVSGAKPASHDPEVVNQPTSM